VNGRMAACSNLFWNRNPTAPMWHGRREGEGKREGGAMGVHVTLGVTLVRFSATLASVARLWIACFV